MNGEPGGDNQKMVRQIVECVPNFSEGRSADTVQEIADAIRNVSGILLLGQEQDGDHNRAVITYVGSPQAVVQAAVAAARVALARIDLNLHQGVHPRIGALDVLPFIPVQNITLAECAALAEQAAQAIWEQCRIPCYLYEAAARRPQNRNLADVRRGGFEGLAKESLLRAERQPDIGGPGLHPTAGATAVGARKFLIAWNVLLQTEDLEIAKSIAALVRQSSGGFPFVKALGLALPSRHMTQVSMNLLDFEETPMQPVFDVIRREAERKGVEVVGSELIGFLPRKALEANLQAGLHFVNFRSEQVLENRIEALAPARFAGNLDTEGENEAESSYRQSLQLLAQAAQWALRAERQGELHAAGCDWAQIAHRASRELDAMPQTQGSASAEREQLQKLLRHAEWCAEVKMQLASTRKHTQQVTQAVGGTDILVTDGALAAVAPGEGRNVGSYDAIWHLLDTSLRFAILGIDKAEKEKEGLRPELHARVNALRSLSPPRIA